MSFPTATLLLNRRKDITVNREKQLLLLRGVIRPDDIAGDNTILSSYVANAEMIYTGDGVVNDKQGQGWLVQVVGLGMAFLIEKPMRTDFMKTERRFLFLLLGLFDFSGDSWFLPGSGPNASKISPVWKGPGRISCSATV